MPALLLPDPHGHQYYTTFYILAFLLNQALLLWEGHRRGYPLRSWLLLTTGATLAFVVGTKLIAMSAADWGALWAHGTWPASTARSVLGGALGGTAAVLVLRRWLGFGPHVFDAFSLPMCAAYAVQCLGCLLTGCCFGHLAPGGWGVLYAPDTLPFLEQVHQGLIPDTAAHSLAVIPTQLLSGLLCVGTAAVLWATRHRAWAGGSWRLLQLTLLLAGRFVIEFWRDPAGEQVGAAPLAVAGLALKQAQWVLLPLVLLAGAWWLRRTRAAALPDVPPAPRPLRILLGVAGLLAATAVLGPGALTLPELLVVKTGLTVVLVLEAAALLRPAAHQPRRLGLPLTLASGVLLFTNQAPAPVADSAATGRYFTVGLGSLSGAYDQDFTDSRGCGSSERYAYYHRYKALGGSAEYTVRDPNRHLQAVGVNLWTGAERIGSRRLDPNGPFLTTDEEFHTYRDIWDVNPYIEFRSLDGGQWALGYRLGLHVGQLTYSARALTREARNGYYRPFQMAPDLMFWTGVRRTLYGQLDMGMGALALGNYTTRLSLGSGLGQDYGSHLLAGVALATHAPQPVMGFVSGQILVGRTGLVLEPYFATDFDRHYQLNGQLRYRFSLGNGRRR